MYKNKTLSNTNVSNINVSNTNVSNINTPIELIKIKKNCDGLHKHCQEICQKATQQIHLVSQEYFDEFMMMMKYNNLNSCLSQHSNTRSYTIKDFIIKCSEFLIINHWNAIISYFTDEQTNQIINNQKKLIPDFIEIIINLENIISNYGSKVNLINALTTHPIKIKSYENIIMSMEIGQFSKYIHKIIKNYNTSTDNVIINYINLNKQTLKLPANKEIGIKIMYSFINRPGIVKHLYRIISNTITHLQKIELFNKCIVSYDKDLMFVMLENKDIVPDSITIDRLVEKCYTYPGGNQSPNAKTIAEIIDLLCEYGLVISKQIIIKLIEHGCYVNNLEKHGIEVDSEILAKCANQSYYPYKFDIKPTVDILIKECSKYDNLNTIKKLKEFGGVYSTECLEEACSVPKNGRVIKYLINECNVNVSEKCLEKFQEAYKMEALDAVMKKYKKQNPESHKINSNEQKVIELDKNSIMSIIPKNIKIDKNDVNYEFAVKGKIQKFFELKSKNIKYFELYEATLKYLISNKLIIGNYFIINDKLSKLLKINQCTIASIDDIHNILTYFIDISN